MIFLFKHIQNSICYYFSQFIKKSKYLFLLSIITTSLFSYSQEHSDIKYLLEQIPHLEGKTKIDSLNKLSSLYSRIDNSKSILYVKEALKYSIELNYKKGIAHSYSNIGVASLYDNNINDAIKYLNKSLYVYKEINDTNNVTKLYINISALFYNNSEYDKSIEYANIAIDRLKKYPFSYNKQLAFSTLYNNLALCYENKEEYEKALSFIKKCIKIKKKSDISNSIGNTYGNLAMIYENLDSTKLSINFYNKSIYLLEQKNDEYGLIISYTNLGKLYLEHNIDSADLYLHKGLSLALKINAYQNATYCYGYLSKLNEKNNNYKQALKNYKFSISYKDSINNKNQHTDINEINTKYEKEQKEKDLKIIELKKRNNKIIKYSLSAILAIFIFLIFIIQNRYKIKRESENNLKKLNNEISNTNQVLNQQAEELKILNKSLNHQNEEITQQRDEIQTQKEKSEEIYKNVSESIDYAKRIQTSILPGKSFLRKYISDYFILFKPKDIVSGDFYWASHINNHTIITASDSTGHGVPGAFMSMLGALFLREIVEKENITHTGTILNKLRKRIIKALKQKGKMGEQKDGMDMAIVSINHETNILQFSGANNPLYIITERKLDQLKPLKDFKNCYEIKPDKMPIAIYEKMDDFTTHEIQLEKGDMLYMFSDGFIDQFGGPKGKKFKYKAFRQLLADNMNKPMKKQKEILNLAFETWKGDLEQVDDVVIIGLEI